STARPCLANRFLCWAAKIEKLDRPGKTITFKWVWVGAALIVPNMAAHASAASMRLRVGRMVDPSGFVLIKSNTGRAEFVQPSASVVVLALERKPFDHGFLAEALAQAIHCLLGAGAAAIDEIGEIRAVRLAQAGEPDADEPKHGAVDLAPEQIPPHGED